MITTVYAATYIEKRATRDHEATGCETESHCVMSERINLEAATLKGLVEKLKSAYGHDGNYLDIPDGGGAVGWNQYENDNSDTLTVDQCKDYWKRGKNVWLCDYLFSIEKREVTDIAAEEIEELEGYTFG